VEGRGGDVRGGECCGVQKICKIDPAGQPAMHAVRDIVLPIILALCVSNAGTASTRMDKSSQFLTNWQVYHSSLLNPTAVTKF